MGKYLLMGGALLLLLLGGFFLAKSGGKDTTGRVSFSHAHGIAVDAGEPNKLYIATHEGLYLLENESVLSRVGAGHDDLMGFSAHPTQPGTFFSSGHPARGGNIGFQKSTDGGVTWQKVSDGLNGPADFHAMAVSRMNPDVVYGFFRGLQRSVDGGRAWEMARGTIAPISLSTHPTKDVVYAATAQGVMMSDDRGDSWQSLSPELEGGAVSVFHYFPDDTALVFSQRLGGMGRSADSGATWQKLNEPFDGGNVLFIASPSTSGTTYAITDRDAIYKSTDQGVTWSKVR